MSGHTGRRLALAAGTAAAVATVMTLAILTGAVPVQAGSEPPDITGYTPWWAEQKNQSQLLWRCLETAEPGYWPEADYKWCGQYVGRVLDGFVPDESPLLDGPRWYQEMGEAEALAACRAFEQGQYVWWCGIYAGLVLDGLGPPGLFADDTGYMPDWTDDSDALGVMLACRFADESGTLEGENQNWCGQYARYILHRTLSPADTVIADSSGYTPDWAADAGPDGAYSECQGQVRGADAAWCAEFVPLYIFASCHDVPAAYPQHESPRPAGKGVCAGHFGEG